MDHFFPRREVAFLFISEPLKLSFCVSLILSSSFAINIIWQSVVAVLCFSHQLFNSFTNYPFLLSLSSRCSMAYSCWEITESTNTTLQGVYHPSCREIYCSVPGGASESTFLSCIVCRRLTLSFAWRQSSLPFNCALATGNHFSVNSMHLHAPTTSQQRPSSSRLFIVLLLSLAIFGTLLRPTLAQHDPDNGTNIIEIEEDRSNAENAIQLVKHFKEHIRRQIWAIYNRTQLASDESIGIQANESLSKGDGCSAKLKLALESSDNTTAFEWLLQSKFTL